MSLLVMVVSDEDLWERDEIKKELSSLQAGIKVSENSINQQLEGLTDGTDS